MVFWTSQLSLVRAYHLRQKSLESKTEYRLVQAHLAAFRILILARAAYAQRIDWMGEGNPETAIAIADLQLRMETALEDFEEQAEAFRAKNKVEGFCLTNKPLISEVFGTMAG